MGLQWRCLGLYCNQMVLGDPMPKEQCEEIASKWTKFEMNKYFRFSIECIQDTRKNI